MRALAIRNVFFFFFLLFFYSFRYVSAAPAPAGRRSWPSPSACIRWRTRRRSELGAYVAEVEAVLAVDALQQQLELHGLDVRLQRIVAAQGHQGRRGVARERCAAGSAMEPDPQQRDQAPDVEGLRDVVRRAGRDALLAVALHRLGGQGDDRQRGVARVGADAPHRLVAVHLRHHHVHQDEVDLGMAVEHLERVAPVLGVEHAHALGLERAGDGVDVAHVVVDHQDRPPGEGRVAARAAARAAGACRPAAAPGRGAGTATSRRAAAPASSRP